MLSTNFPLKTPETLKAIKVWWETFTLHQEDFDKRFEPHSTHDFDVVEFMHKKFAIINAEMCWEFGPGKSKKHMLAIAPERNKGLDPLARLIFSLAPEFVDFEIVVNRQPTIWEDYRAYTDGRIEWSGPDDILFDMQNGKNNLFDIVFHVPQSTKAKDIYSACFITCETLLGEEIMAKWVGCFDVETLPKRSLLSKLKPATHSHLKSLEHLRQTLAENIARLKNNLQDFSFIDMPEESDWSLMSMEPKEARDYEPLRDLITAVSPSADLFQSYYSNREQFYSERFSKFGEHFIFVQLDGSADDLGEEIYSDRGEIEDALEASLMKDKIGKVVGGGTGRKYSYIHLAVLDLSEAISRIKQTLRNGKITRRSWIMLHDADRQQEWIGVWDDTPAPKLPSLD